MADSQSANASVQYSQYTLTYGMRLDPGTGPELLHPQVPVTLPDGSKGTMALHVINGTPMK